MESDPTATPPAENGQPKLSSQSDPIERVLRELTALREFWAHLVTARIDTARARIRDLAMSAGLGVAAGLIGATILVTCSIAVVRGAAGGLAAALGDRVWLGELLAGVAGLGLLAALALLAFRVSRRRRLQATAGRYEQRKTQQRARVGLDVTEAARAVQ